MFKSAAIFFSSLCSHSHWKGGGAGHLENGPVLSLRFDGLRGLALSESECAVYVNELNARRIRRITLPSRLFGRAGRSSDLDVCDVCVFTDC